MGRGVGLREFSVGIELGRVALEKGVEQQGWIEKSWGFRAEGFWVVMRLFRGFVSCWLIWREGCGSVSWSLWAGGETYTALSSSTPLCADSVIAPTHSLCILRTSLESRHVLVYSTVSFRSAIAAGRCFGDSTIGLRYSDSLVHC